MTFTSNGSQSIDSKPGVEYVASAQGTFSSGSVALEFSLDGGVTWSPITDSNGAVVWTSANACAFLAPGSKARLTLSGAGTPAITAFIQAR